MLHESAQHLPESFADSHLRLSLRNSLPPSTTKECLLRLRVERERRGEAIADARDCLGGLLSE
jgi:hypothetical protein